MPILVIQTTCGKMMFCSAKKKYIALPSAPLCKRYAHIPTAAWSCYSYISYNSKFRYVVAFHNNGFSSMDVAAFLRWNYCHIPSMAWYMVYITNLLTKLHHYGFQFTPMKWSHSFLKDRSQYVDYDKTISKIWPITTGVPQRSILGPLPFII